MLKNIFENREFQPVFGCFGDGKDRRTLALDADVEWVGAVYLAIALDAVWIRRGGPVLTNAVPTTWPNPPIKIFLALLVAGADQWLTLAVFTRADARTVWAGVLWERRVTRAVASAAYRVDAKVRQAFLVCFTVSSERLVGGIWYGGPVLTNAISTSWSNPPIKIFLALIVAGAEQWLTLAVFTRADA